MNNLRISFVVLFLLLACSVICGCDDSSDASITIVTTELPNGRIFVYYELTLQAADNDGQVTWSLVGGTLPGGLTCDASGVISGEPTETGNFSITVKADDGSSSAQANLNLHVVPVLLMSGFEPFGGYDTNPSMEAIRPLDQQIVSDFDVRIVELPVVWDESWDILAAAIDLYGPSAIIATGMAGTDAMRFETTAKNKQFGTDNDGVKRSGDPIVEDGPDTLPTGLPLDQMVSAVDTGGYNTVVSDNAGTYLCNHVFYHLMYYVTYQATEVFPAGFIHVPPAPYDGSFTVDDITAAHQLAIEALAQNMDSSQKEGYSIGTSEEPRYFNLDQKQ